MFENRPLRGPDRSESQVMASHPPPQESQPRSPPQSQWLTNAISGWMNRVPLSWAEAPADHPHTPAQTKANRAILLIFISDRLPSSLTYLPLMGNCDDSTNLSSTRPMTTVMTAALLAVLSAGVLGKLQLTRKSGATIPTVSGGSCEAMPVTRLRESLFGCETEVFQKLLARMAVAQKKTSASNCFEADVFCVCLQVHYRNALDTSGRTVPPSHSNELACISMLRS